MILLSNRIWKVQPFPSEVSGIAPLEIRFPGGAKNKKEPALNQDFQVLLRCFCVLAPFLGPATLGGQITKVEGRFRLMILLSIN